MNEYKVYFELEGLRTGLQADLIQTELFRQGGAPIVKHETRFELSLAPGIYRARLSSAGNSHDTLIVVDPKPNQRIHLPVPERFSSVPMPDVLGHHEYYAASFSERSPTRAPLNTQDNNAPYLFIYLRMRDQQQAQQFIQQTQHVPKLFHGLKLLDASGKCITRFSDDEVYEMPDIGMARFRAKIAPGYYRLVYTTEDERREWIPLPVFSSAWDTDLSMLWNEGPLFATMSLFTPSSSGASHLDLDTYDMQINDIDTVIQTIASGQRVENLKSSTVYQLLNNKFSNPMMGILGLYLYLLRDQVDADNVRVVLNNLRLLAPNSPDVEALHVIACERGVIDKPDHWQFKDIPLVRLGAMAMQRASLTSDDTQFSIPSHAEQLFLHLKTGSPWAQTDCVRQPPLETPAALEFNVDHISLERLVLDVRPQAYNLHIDEPRVESMSQRLGVLSYLKSLAKASKAGLEIKERDSDSGIPPWLTEALIKQITTLARAKREGSLGVHLAELAAKWEVMLPTLQKLAARMLAESQPLSK